MRRRSESDLTISPVTQLRHLPKRQTSPTQWTNWDLLLAQLRQWTCKPKEGWVVVVAEISDSDVQFPIVRQNPSMDGARAFDCPVWVSATGRYMWALLLGPVTYSRFKAVTRPEGCTWGWYGWGFMNKKGGLAFQELCGLKFIIDHLNPYHPDSTFNAVGPPAAPLHTKNMH